MIRTLTFAFLLVVTTAAVAQAPIERRPPAPTVVLPIHLWPQPDAIAHHKRLIVTLKSDFGVTHLCQLDQLDTDTIACEGRHHQDIRYTRADINSISILQTHVPVSTYVLGAVAIVGIVSLIIGSEGLFLLSLIVEGCSFPSALDFTPSPPTGKLIYLAESAYDTAAP